MKTSLTLLYASLGAQASLTTRLCASKRMAASGTRQEGCLGSQVGLLFKFFSTRGC